VLELIPNQNKKLSIVFAHKVCFSFSLTLSYDNQVVGILIIHSIIL